MRAWFKYVSWDNYKKITGFIIIIKNKKWWLYEFCNFFWLGLVISVWPCLFKLSLATGRWVQNHGFAQTQVQGAAPYFQQLRGSYEVVFR